MDHLYSTSDLISTSSEISGDSLVVFNLSSDFAEKFISNGDSIYKRTSEWTDTFKIVFKGIGIIPELTGTSGGLVTTDITSKNTKIVLYYSTEDEDSLQLPFTLFSGYRYAKYTNDNSSSLLNDYLTNDSEISDDLIFLQGLNGVLSKLKFNNYKDWLEDDSTYSILNAELIIPVFMEDEFKFDPPQYLYFYFSDSDSSLYNVEDYQNSNGLFDGVYDSENQNYHFNISKHFKSLINGSIEDSCLNFSIANRSYYPKRVILKSGNNIKFNVTYTKH